MTQIAVDDRLITKARTLLEGEGFTDEEIVNAALDRWVDDKENSKDLDRLFDECQGKLHWDPEFAGVGPEHRRPVW
ncbi:MAG: hypothetical protein LBR23_03475 [Spirochaetaceae bacterium]|jgi:hypothetical protein|nr:hypothetical protein [Spirochaetaceae bacterium]